MDRELEQYEARRRAERNRELLGRLSEGRSAEELLAALKALKGLNVRARERARAQICAQDENFCENV